MRELGTLSTRGAPTQRPLLAAKMAAPELGEAIARPRLFATLDDARPVALVVAPAGWGKTVLVSSWLGSHDGRSAWLTAEAGDRLADLWSYVEAALSVPNSAEPSVLPPGDHESLVHLAAAVAELPVPVTLVVDAAEQINQPEFVTGLDYLVGHAGGKLRLILAARSAQALPAHRWRLRDNLTELTADDLAFTTAEVIELLAAHGRALSGDQADQLRQRAEGWPAGLRLAALAFGDHPEPARFVAEFGGDRPEVTEYLAEEVLARLSPQAVDAFTRSAIEDQLCGGLVDAVADRVDGAALLADAARTTGFTLRVNNRDDLYRHHRMLADVFRARLARRPEAAIQNLHRRAARWFTDNGQPARALRHALTGQAWSLAETVLRQRWRDLLPPVEVTGSAPPPPTPEQLRSRPALALAYAADRLATGDARGFDAYLRDADVDEHLVTAPRNVQIAVTAAALRLGRAQLRGDPAQVRAAAHRLLALAQPDPAAAPLDGGARGIARIAEGAALLSAGHLESAEEALVGGVSDADEADLPRIVGRGTSRLALVRALRGQLGSAVDCAHRALAHLDPDVPGDRAPAYLALALVGLERDRPDEVAAHLIPAALTTDPLVAGLAMLSEARLRADRGDSAGAGQGLQSARRWADAAGSRYLMTCIAVTGGELRAGQGDRDAGRAELSRLVETEAEPSGAVAVALARAHLRAQDPRAAAVVLAGRNERAHDPWPVPVRLTAGVLDAEAARQLGDGRRAARLLEQVLALAEPEGFRRIFTRADPPVRELLGAHLDAGTAFWPLVNELLAADSGAVAPDRGPGAPREPLTERELTILRYLQSVLSNVEIARELSVSVNTIKTHVRSIYRKLNASRRRDAVRRAREWHLL